MKQSYFARGNQLFQEQRYEEAVEAYRKAIEQNPSFYLSHHNLGDALNKLEFIEEAAHSYRRAIELHPGSSPSHSQLSQLLQTPSQKSHKVENYSRTNGITSHFPKVVQFNQASLNAKSTENIDSNRLGHDADDRESSHIFSEIYIVTPSYKAVETIDRTIASVVFQSGDFSLHYHVQDGGSNDGTLKILQNWSERFKLGTLPLMCRSIDFTFTSISDGGLYDAIVRGFSRFDIQENDWMTWINADDILMPGACALMAEIDQQFDKTKIRWVTGNASVAHHNVPMVNCDRPLNKDVIKSGLCDGKHWSYVQQEGCFFRNRLWRLVDVDKSFKNYKYAGDWNLWRLFAQSGANIFRISYPVGQFSKREGQISEDHRDSYQEEIDKTIPLGTRSHNLQELRAISLKGHIIKGELNGKLSIVEESLDHHKDYWLQRQSEYNVQSIDRNSSIPGNKVQGELENGTNQSVLITRNIIALDTDWQYPAITEKYAFTKACELLPDVRNAIYFAFPWATLIDKLRNNSSIAKELLECLQTVSKDLKKYQCVVTVCQHVLMLDYQHLFIDSGITHVYWSHAIKEQLSFPKDSNVKILPFPLFPVQASNTNNIQSNDVNQGKYLYSFVGAKPDQWYLTNSRNWIIDKLSEDERGLIICRDQWHFQDIVYKHQILGDEISEQQLALQQVADIEYRSAMTNSIFCLCPSGSGPNSIRLWEAISYGTIPVILSDKYQHPGDDLLWEEATISCQENLEAILALPNYLKELAKDEDAILRKQTALKQLWMLYGLDCFIYDIINLFISFQQEEMLCNQCPSDSFPLQS